MEGVLMIQISTRFSHPPVIKHGIPENPSLSSMIFPAINLLFRSSNAVPHIFPQRPMIFPSFRASHGFPMAKCRPRSPRHRGPGPWAIHEAGSVGGLDDQLICPAWDGNSAAIAFLGSWASELESELASELESYPLEQMLRS